MVVNEQGKMDVLATSEHGTYPISPNYINYFIYPNSDRGVMVFNTTFNNISVILVEETGVSGENHRPATSH